MSDFFAAPFMFGAICCLQVVSFITGRGVGIVIVSEEEDEDHG